MAPPVEADALLQLQGGAELEGEVDAGSFLAPFRTQRGRTLQGYKRSSNSKGPDVRAKPGNAKGLWAPKENEISVTGGAALGIAKRSSATGVGPVRLTGQQLTQRTAVDLPYPARGQQPNRSSSVDEGVSQHRADRQQELQELTVRNLPSPVIFPCARVQWTNNRILGTRSGAGCILTLPRLCAETCSKC